MGVCMCVCVCVCVCVYLIYICIRTHRYAHTVHRYLVNKAKLCVYLYPYMRRVEGFTHIYTHTQAASEQGQLTHTNTTHTNTHAN